jgi:hypothetical protein
MTQGPWQAGSSWPAPADRGRAEHHPVALPQPSRLLSKRRPVTDLPISLSLFAAAVVILAAAAAYADGVFDRAFDAHFWRLLLLQPALSVWWVGTLVVVGAMRDRALASLRAIVLLPGGRLAALCAEQRAVGRRFAWACVAAGVLAGNALLQPWNASTDLPRVYALRLLMTAIVWALIGGFVGETLSAARLLARLQREQLRLDLFDLSPLLPVARWALSIVLGFAGGATVVAAVILDEEVLRAYLELR